MKILAMGAGVALLYIFAYVCAMAKGEGVAAAECTADDDCQPAINGSACIGGQCACPNTAPLLVNATKLNASFCLPKYNETGGSCAFDEQCAYANGACSSGGRCACRPRFKEEGGQCAKNSVIPIAVGVSIGVAVFATLILYCWCTRKKE